MSTCMSIHMSMHVSTHTRSRSESIRRAVSLHMAMPHVYGHFCVCLYETHVHTTGLYKYLGTCVHTHYRVHGYTHVYTRPHTCLGTTTSPPGLGYLGSLFTWSKRRRRREATHASAYFAEGRAPPHCARTLIFWFSAPKSYFPHACGGC